ncbi:MAG: ATP-binding protein [Robiginitomaculum sp.]|nr:ATP-binding protein [Robiginitomaculum sp.]MDQ7077682.1 ATP-binding protein [Robiginitomaculum sp.]
MLEISEDDILDRMRVDNPWWSTGQVLTVSDYKKRAYYESFAEEAMQTAFRRAVVLMGPRRVGKTVMIHQLIADLIENGMPPEDILYISMDTPVYNRLSPEQAMKIYLKNLIGERKANPVIYFDEIQYVKDWEVHLKSLVDGYPSIRFVVSGSAAAALKMKSAESGAGRFTDFLLPPLTFSEYLNLKGLEDEVITVVGHDEYSNAEIYGAQDIQVLNKRFVDYINFGGYPEIALSNEGAESLAKRLGADVIEKVLLRDLPSLYGIGDVTELHALFTTLAYNTGQEVTLDELSQSANISKNTLKRYLEYLESAFLIKRVERIDQNAKRFKRAMSFKIYLTSPSMRAALFGPVDEADNAMGGLVETAIFSQWFHSSHIDQLRYARWDKSKDGEVDIVYLDRHLPKPIWCLEVKWSDRYYDAPNKLKSLAYFISKNPQLIDVAGATTKTKRGMRRVMGEVVEFTPSAEYCYTVGKNVLKHKKAVSSDENSDEQPDLFHP